MEFPDLQYSKQSHYLIHVLWTVFVIAKKGHKQMQIIRRFISGTDWCNRINDGENTVTP